MGMHFENLRLHLRWEKLNLKLDEGEVINMGAFPRTQALTP